MKLSGPVVCFVACLAPALVKAGLKVPGDSPFEFCKFDRDNDVLQIKKIDITPNPPTTTGQEVVITLRGTSTKPITKGSYVKFTLKYGLIQLITTTADFCEQLAGSDATFPLQKGDTVLRYKYSMGVTPPGIYNLYADMYTDDDEQITCLKASFNIPRPSLPVNEL